MEASRRGGGLIAGQKLALPCAAAMMLLAAIQFRLGMLPIAYALFFGVKATAIVLVAESLARLSGQSPLSLGRWVVAILSFIPSFAFGLHLPVVIAVAAGYGAAIGVGSRREYSSPPSAASRKDELRTISVMGAIWAVPLALVWAAGFLQRLLEAGLHFGRLAADAFGGVCSVLADMPQTGRRIAAGSPQRR